MKFYEIYSDYANSVFSKLNSVLEYNIHIVNKLIKQGITINQEFKNHILNHRFKSLNEEIHFYKEVKPKLIGLIDTLLYVREIEIKYTHLKNVQKLKVFNKIKKGINKEILSGSDLNYYLNKSPEYDKYYFTTLSISDIEKHASFKFSNDIGYCCSLGLKVSKLHELDFKLEYWTIRIKNLKKSNNISSSNYPKKLKWKADKVDFVELIYGLVEANAFDKKEFSYADVFETFSSVVDLGSDKPNLYKTMDHIKSRKKHATKFIDKVQHSLNNFVNK